MNTSKVTVFQDNQDTGWLGSNQSWWFDPEFEHSFSIFDLDAFYEDNYFKNDHVNPQVVKRYVSHVLDYGQKMLGREVRSILELGCGGGWFTEEFLKRGIDIIAVEGTHAGHRHALQRGVPAERLIRHDLRQPLTLTRTFDLAVCTEVAEHIECPFSSQLVRNITSYARVAWFSFEEPATNDAHYHHCNEQPEKFWRNLFRYFGFDAFTLPAQVTESVEGRGDLVCYSREIALPPELAGAAQQIETSSVSAGKRTEVHADSGGLKSGIKQLVPPIIWDNLRRLKHEP